MYRCFFYLCFFIAANFMVVKEASAQKQLVVNADGKGDFKTIQATINSLPDSSNAPIYQAETSKGVQWGNRCYFYNCHNLGGDYNWLKNNLAAAEDAPSPQIITANWAFDHQWEPLKSD